MNHNKDGARTIAHCEYPGCKATFPMSNPTGLCHNHREMAVFTAWFLEKKLRLGVNGPTLIEVAVASKTLLERLAQEQDKNKGKTIAASLYGPDGKPLLKF